MTAPTAPLADEVVMVVRMHQDFTEVFRLMKERLGLTDQFCDLRGGLTRGHTNKILGPTESRHWGPSTFDLFCEMFCVEFHAKIDMEAVKRMEVIWEERVRPFYPNKRVSKKLIELAKPHVFKASGKVGADARMIMLRPEHRQAIARKAAKKRWRKWAKKMGRRGGKVCAKRLSRRQRVERARTAANARWDKAKTASRPKPCATSS
jgi:hypothetical protein